MNDALSIYTAIPFFSEAELQSRDQPPGAGVIRLDARFAYALVHLRCTWGQPLRANSVCRTPAHNAAIKGHPRSLHLTENPVHTTNGCMAIDVDWKNWQTDERSELFLCAKSLRWSVGLHPEFVHLDRRVDLGMAATVFIYENSGWKTGMLHDRPA